MSQEGVYLDAATCFRLGERAAGKPAPQNTKVFKPPKAPALNGTPEMNALRQSQYEKSLAAAIARAERQDRDLAEFANLEFVWARVVIPGARVYDEERIMAMLTYKGTPVLGDVVTGSLYRDDDGTCLSSTQIRVAGPRWPSTQADRKTYMNTRGEEKDMGGNPTGSDE